ncbi:MAG: hypothetical protein FWJ64_06185 [Limnochordia bacterium]
MDGAERKVAIVGGGPSRRKAPFDDPSWEIWAFSSRKWRYPRVDRWFELHHMTDLRQQLATYRPGRRSWRGYMRMLRRMECPVYLQELHPDIPNGVRYPIEEALERFGRCFTSTASYLVALAILEGYDCIGLWGIDVRRKEYLKQRPALKYLLSIAKNQGIRVVLPRQSPLYIPKTPRLVRTRALYAYDWRSKHAWWRERVRRRLRRLRRLKRLRRRRARR